jgi:hypothetical protein
MTTTKPKSKEAVNMASNRIQRLITRVKGTDSGELMACAFVVFLVVFFLCANLNGQESKPATVPVKAAPVAAQKQRTAPAEAKATAQAGDKRPSEPVAGEVPLTEVEALRVKVNAQDRQILEMEMTEVGNRVEAQFHFHQRQQDLTVESQKLMDSLAKAHRLDPTKYRLDTDKKSFVPLKPADGK